MDADVLLPCSTHLHTMTDQKRASRMQQREVNPLLSASFSKFNSSLRSTPNQSRDSGFHDISSTSNFSSNNTSNSSLTPASSNTNSFQIYSSTPLIPRRSSHILDHQTSSNTHFTPPSNTPVNLPCRRLHAFERIPSTRSIPGPLLEDEGGVGDWLGVLTRNGIGNRHIFQYLSGEDLLKMCQVSDLYCSSICRDRDSLKRLSQYLKREHDNLENRPRNLRPRRGRSSGNRVLRQMQNLPPSAFAVDVDPSLSNPSVLEAIDVHLIPRRLKFLLEMTAALNVGDYVASCRTCRGLTVVTEGTTQLPTLCEPCQLRSKKSQPMPSKKMLSLRSM